MKKTLTLLLMLAATLAAQAQHYIFVDSNGQQVANGSTLTRSTPKDNPMTVSGYEIGSGLFVKNVDANSDYTVLVETTISQIDNGELECCFPATCQNYRKTGTYSSAQTQFGQGETASLHSEWLPAADGTCTVTYTLKVFNGPFEMTDSRYAVTIGYLFNMADIKQMAADAPQPAMLFDALGRRHTTAPRGGISIVRMSDGTVRKMVKPVSR